MEHEPWKLRDIYLYLVSLITLIIMVIGTIQTIGQVGDYIFNPRNYYYPTLMEIENRYRYSDQEIPSLEELQQIQDNEIKLQEQQQQGFKLKEILDSLALVLIPLPIYLFHWRRVKPGPEEGSE